MLGEGKHSPDGVLFDGGPDGGHGGSAIDGVGEDFFSGAYGFVSFQGAGVSVGFGRLVGGAFLDGESPGLAFFSQPQDEVPVLEQGE